MNRRIRRSPIRSQPRLEPLEARLVLNGPGDFVMLSASAPALTKIDVKYEVDDAPLTAPYTVGIYRSVDAKFDSGDPRIGSITLATSDLTVGSHETLVTLAAPRGINPSLKYVLAVGDPAGQATESSTADNVASFRVWTVAAVTHGYQSTGTLPAWVTQMTTALSAQGFDATIPYNWAALSNVPVPGIVPQVAQGLAAQVGQTIAGLGVGMSDVVDIQLIGHSRGAGVVAAAAGLLPTTTPPLVGGNLKLTLLDPHPARNDAVPYYSFDKGPVGQLGLFSFLAFQGATNDPKVVIPSNVTQAEVFYEQTLVQNTIPVIPDELLLMSWGNTPIAGSPAGGTTYYDLTKFRTSHEGTHVFYQKAIVPTLGMAVPYPIMPSLTPGVPKDGGASFPTTKAGRRYEQALLVKLGSNSCVACFTLGEIAELDRYIARNQVGTARHELAELTRYVTHQRGKGLPTSVADQLLALFQQTSFLLNPPKLAARPSSGHAMA